MRRRPRAPRTPPEGGRGRGTPKPGRRGPQPRRRIRTAGPRLARPGRPRPAPRGPPRFRSSLHAVEPEFDGAAEPVSEEAVHAREVSKQAGEERVGPVPPDLLHANPREEDRIPMPVLLAPLREVLQR